MLLHFPQALLVMHRQAPLWPGPHNLAAASSWRHMLREHISRFGERDSVLGLAEHLGAAGNPFGKCIAKLLGTFNNANPRHPVRVVESVDADLRDLVGRMTDMNPAGRISAREALVVREGGGGDGWGGYRCKEEQGGRSGGVDGMVLVHVANTCSVCFENKIGEALLRR